MNIVIADLDSAIALVKENPDMYRVVSIRSYNQTLGFIPKPKLEGAIEILYLQFDDVEEKYLSFFSPDEFKLATKKQCKDALEFLDKGGKCLVHCRAGISRSTAMVLGHLLKKHNRYQQAVEELFQIRPCADPNNYVLTHMCELLGQEKIYKDMLLYIRTMRNKVTKKTNTKPNIKPYFN